MVNGTSAAIDELLKILAQLRRGHDQTFSRLAELERDIDAIETTLKFLRAGQPKDASTLVDIDELRGKTQLQGLKAIAEKGGGEVKVTEAKRLMLEAGLFQSTKNVSQKIYNTIKRSDFFVRVRPGVYRLKHFQRETGD